jgi:hypothetical protein
MIVKVNPLNIEFSRRIQGLCRIPYHGHSKGCPNYGKKRGCPPGQPLIDNILDFESDLFIIYTRHKVGEFAAQMMERHPEWNDRQCYNPRYWQGGARKIHRIERERALEFEGIEKIVWPENHGINVSSLMKNIGIKLNWLWPPEHNLENFTYIISLGGKIVT